MGANDQFLFGGHTKWYDATFALISWMPLTTLWVRLKMEYLSGFTDLGKECYYGKVFFPKVYLLTWSYQLQKSKVGWGRFCSLLTQGSPGSFEKEIILLCALFLGPTLRTLQTPLMYLAASPAGQPQEPSQSSSSLQAHSPSHGVVVGEVVGAGVVVQSASWRKNN